MIIGRSFDGDGDDELIVLQHDAYGESVDEIARVSKGAYIRAAKIVGAEYAPLTRAVEAALKFDHRALQHAHDHLAAYWRANTKQIHPVLPGLRDPAETLQRWRDWLCNEVGGWPKFHPKLVQLVAVILAHLDRQHASEAEGELAKLLGEIYPLPGRTGDDL